MNKNKHEQGNGCYRYASYISYFSKKTMRIFWPYGNAFALIVLGIAGGRGPETTIPPWPRDHRVALYSWPQAFGVASTRAGSTPPKAHGFALFPAVSRYVVYQQNQPMPIFVNIGPISTTFWTFVRLHYGIFGLWILELPFGQAKADQTKPQPALNPYWAGPASPALVLRPKRSTCARWRTT